MAVLFYAVYNHYNSCILFIILCELFQSSLSTWTNHKTLVGAVQVLSSRLSLLEPMHLDHVEGRLHVVHTRMNSIAEKKTAIEDADKQSKVGTS